MSANEYIIKTLCSQLKLNIQTQRKCGINMNNKYIGIALIVIGVALAAWGLNIYDSASSQITRAFSGDTPIEAWAGMAGGTICVVIGILKIK